MMAFFGRALLAILALLLLGAGLPAIAATTATTARTTLDASSNASHPVLLRKFNLAPSVDLDYTIKARQSGLQIQGEASVQWRTDGKTYSVSSTTRAMLIGKILEANSSGTIDRYGLAPTSFTETRFRKASTSTSFTREADAAKISFAQSDASYPLLGGEQDRTSVIWQLVALARAAPQQFKTGSTWNFFVAGQRDAERWSFKVVGSEKIRSLAGDQRTLHIVRAPPPDDKSQTLDIWLAPELEWYPVKLRFSETDGDYIEQRLVRQNQP